MQIATVIPGRDLALLTGGLLFLSAVLVMFRMFFSVRNITAIKPGDGMKFWLASAGLGLFCGVLSGAFGIGSAWFIQLGLLFFFSLTLPQVAGTTMLVIIPIAIMGGFGFLIEGYMDMLLFVQVAAGLTLGTYIGAKFTKRLPRIVLKIGMVAVPASAAALLILTH